MSPRPLRPDEAELWRRIVRHVAPFPGKVAPEPTASVFLPISPERPARQETKAKIPKAAAKPAPPAGPRNAPADRGGEKRVRRGHIEIAAKLDLHGLHQDGARHALEIFLRRSAEQGARVVLVVTGKGMRRGAEAPKPGVLRSQTPLWLAAPQLRPLVAGYACAHAKHGGEGALYVFLRRQAAIEG